MAFLYLCRIPYDITFSHARFEVLTAVLLRIQVFCDVMLYLISLTLKMKALQSFEMSTITVKHGVIFRHALQNENTQGKLFEVTFGKNVTFIYKPGSR
jgi:hypothetical protein